VQRVLEPGLVSVITATHNRPLFIRKAIDLFEAQTWPKKEMIIIDDGAAGIVPTLLPENVRHVRLTSPTWITHKHRLAFPLCRGEFVGYWDDDDYFGPRRLALQAQHLMEGKADAVGFHVKVLVSVPDPRFWKWSRKTLDKWDREAKPGFDAGLPFHDGTALWRHELLEGVPEARLQGSQLDLMRTLRAGGARLAELPNDDTFVYVRHSRVGWDFDVRELCDPVDCPRWIPREMLAFWALPTLADEGVKRG
jgi:Glycosyltransferases involved in cell wall biogenesis